MTEVEKTRYNEPALSATKSKVTHLKCSFLSAASSSEPDFFANVLTQPYQMKCGGVWDGGNRAIENEIEGQKSTPETGRGARSATSSI